MVRAVPYLKKRSRVLITAVDYWEIKRIKLQCARNAGVRSNTRKRGQVRAIKN